MNVRWSSTFPYLKKKRWLNVTRRNMGCIEQVLNYVESICRHRFFPHIFHIPPASLQCTYSSVFVRLGQLSLPFYLFYRHILLSANGNGILALVPGHVYVSLVMAVPLCVLASAITQHALNILISILFNSYDISAKYSVLTFRQVIVRLSLLVILVICVCWP